MQFITHLVVSQNVFQRIYNEHPDGDHKSYYSNGNIKVSVTIINGLIEGRHYNYYKNGNIQSYVEFLHGKLHGQEFHYLKNGKIRSEIVYRNDSLISQKDYYYKYTLLKGIQIWDIYNDSINPEKFPINNLMSGNGNVFSNPIIILHGYYTEYYQNGNKKFEGQYIDRKKNGTWIYYDTEENIEKKILYKNNKVIKIFANTQYSKKR